MDNTTPGKALNRICMAIAMILILNSFFPNICLCVEGSDNISIWLKELKQPDEGRWRKAEIWLAKFGDDALPSLEKFASDASDEEKLKMENVLELALLKTISYENLKNFPNLYKLCEEKFNESLNMINNLEIARVKLADMGGFSIPAVIKLCNSINPNERALGISTIGLLEAVSQINLLKKLQGDSGIYEHPADDVAYGQISNLVRQTLELHDSFLINNPQSSFYKNRVEIELRNFTSIAIRQAKMRKYDHCLLRYTSDPNWTPKTWEEWWRDSDKIWSDYWKNESQGNVIEPITASYWR